MGYRFADGLVGTKVILVGHDPSAFNYDDIQTAIDNAQNNDTIVIEPGIYTLTKGLTCTKPLRFKGIGKAGDNGVTITQDAAFAVPAPLFTFTPSSFAAGVQLSFEDIYFLGVDDGQDLLFVDDTKLQQKIKLKVDRCIMEYVDTTNTAFAINVTHNNDFDRHVVITGTGKEKMAAINLDVTRATDGLEIFDMLLLGNTTLPSLTTGTNAVAFYFHLRNCIIPAGYVTVSGDGNAAQAGYVLGCYNRTTFAMAVAGDFPGSHTVTIKNFS